MMHGIIIYPITNMTLKYFFYSHLRILAGRNMSLESAMNNRHKNDNNKHSKKKKRKKVPMIINKGAFRRHLIFTNGKS